GGDAWEALGVVDAVPVQEPDAVAVLIGKDPPAVDLLLVDPAITVERLGGERGEHRSDLRRHPDRITAPSTRRSATRFRDPLYVQQRIRAAICTVRHGVRRRSSSSEEKARFKGSSTRSGSPGGIRQSPVAWPVWRVFPRLRVVIDEDLKL